MNTKILHQKRSDFERREAASEVRRAVCSNHYCHDSCDVHWIDCGMLLLA